jgi:dihydropteroate synthase
VAPRPTSVLRLGHRTFGPGELVVMAVVDPAAATDPAAAMGRVRTAAAEGADIVVLASPGPAGPSGEISRVADLVAAVRDTLPELVIGVSTGRLEVARAACAAGAGLLCAAGAGLLCAEGAGLLDGPGRGLAEVAAESDASVACPLDLAARVAAAGVEPERVLASVASTRPLADAVASGWPALMSLPEQDLAGSLATAAVAAWLGARAFRGPWVRETRRALSMVSAIRGDVPPAYAVRGLA